MEAYTSFASVYDTFMDNVPYEKWGAFIYDMLCRYGVKDGIVLDLGCGTGTMTEFLAGYGYDMIGVDNSEEMLELAMDKRMKSGHDILYLLQDMRRFELYGTVKAVVSVCDSINYMTDAEDLKEVFRLVNNYLDPAGIFLFDFNTDYKYREVMGDCTIAENRGDCSFIWDNYYYEEERINEYDLTLFIRENAEFGNNRDREGQNGEDQNRESPNWQEQDGENRNEDAGQLYRKFTETHYQRGYTLEEIKQLLGEAGLIFKAAYDMDTGSEVSDISERVCVIAGESGKEIKKHE